MRLELMYYDIRAIMMARLILPTIHRVTPHTHTPHFIHSTRVTRPPSYVLLGTKLPGFLPRGRRVKQYVGSQGEILGTVYDHTAGRFVLWQRQRWRRRRRFNCDCDCIRREEGTQE